MRAAARSPEASRYYWGPEERKLNPRWAPARGSPPGAFTRAGPSAPASRISHSPDGGGKAGGEGAGTRWAGSLCAREPPCSELPTSPNTREAAGHCPAASALGYHLTDGQSRR